MSGSTLQNTRCANVKCCGEIDFVKEIPIDGCNIGFACNICGRLHTEHGVGVRKKQLDAFLSGGVVIFRKWRMAGSKPIGTFRCTVCGGQWDGSELRLCVLVNEARWGCHNLACEAVVEKISDKPRIESSV